MKQYLKYGLVIVLCYIIPFTLFYGCNRVEASTVQIPEDEKRINLQYETTINGIKYQILEIDGWDYIVQENGGITRIKA